MKTILSPSLRFAAALLFGVAGSVFAVESSTASYEEKSLLAPDGTLYVIRAGTAAALQVPSSYARPTDNVITWSSLAQDGSQRSGLVPQSAGNSAKRNLELAFDEPSGALILLYKEEIPLFSLFHIGILKESQWRVFELPPGLPGFSRAYNARTLLTHPTVRTQDPLGRDTWKTCSLLSIIWWEESNVSQARYAPIFLDEDSSASEVQIYDLPAAIGSPSAPTPADLPVTAYRNPALQVEGPGGGLLASFADLGTNQFRVVRIGFSPEALRRRVPIVGEAPTQGPISLARSVPPSGDIEITTYLGAGYNPTLVWRDARAVRFVRFDGRKWSDVNSITLSDTISYDRAMRLVQEMATRN